MSTHRWAALAAVLLAACGASPSTTSREPAPITTLSVDERDDPSERATTPSPPPRADES